MVDSQPSIASTLAHLDPIVMIASYSLKRYSIAGYIAMRAIYRVHRLQMERKLAAPRM